MGGGKDCLGHQGFFCHIKEPLPDSASVLRNRRVMMVMVMMMMMMVTDDDDDDGD